MSTAEFSPDGRFIATSGTNGDVKLWDAKTHREVSRFEDRGEKLLCLTFSPDGRLLAGPEETDDKPQVCNWDVHKGSLLRELDGHNVLTFALAFSPDGNLLATGNEDNTARLWEIPSGNLKATLRGHVAWVPGVAFSPDGKTLATSGYERKVKLCNIATSRKWRRWGLSPAVACRSDSHPMAAPRLQAPGWAPSRTCRCGRFLRLKKSPRRKPR